MSRPREFDHAEAKRLRFDRGLSTVEVGRLLGVTHGAVCRATNVADLPKPTPKQESMSKWARGVWGSMSERDRALVSMWAASETLL